MQFLLGGNHLLLSMAKLDVTTNAGLLAATAMRASRLVKHPAISSQLVDGEAKSSMLVQQWYVAGQDIIFSKTWEPFSAKNAMFKLNNFGEIMSTCIIVCCT